MALIDHKAAPTPSMLRWFGLSLGILLLILGYGLSHASATGGYLVAGTGVVVTTIYYAIPSAQASIIRAWQVITFPIAWLLGHLLLGGVYFLVFLPIGIVMRLVGYDPLELKSWNEKHSTWRSRESKRNADSYFKQF